MVTKAIKFISAIIIAMLWVVAISFDAFANPPADPNPEVGLSSYGKALKKRERPYDFPNPVEQIQRKELLRLNRLIDSGNLPDTRRQVLKEMKRQLTKTGTDKVLVILAEFAGSDSFTWTLGSSTWDPIGQADTAQSTGTAGDCSLIQTETKVFNYSGPLHNEIPRPLSATDRSGDMIWTADFSPDWFNSFMFGNGVVFDYDRVDSSHVHDDYTGKSVSQYYNDMSGGLYSLTGNVVGWVQIPHSTWYYGADTCPGKRSVTTESNVANSGAIPGAGDSRQFVKDVLDAVNAAHPGFDWAQYDTNGDGLIDRLWIVHAGYGEEDGTPLLNRTTYGEAALWSHSWTLASPYVVDATNNISASAYIMMPENGGIGVFAHESAHNIGADDLYAYNGGETSAGFWTLMADDWTGYPIGYEPPALDPWHLDGWGWLNPEVISDSSKSYLVRIGQASSFPGGSDMVRGVRIALPAYSEPTEVRPNGNYLFFGGRNMSSEATMTTASAISLPGGQSAALVFKRATSVETNYDYFKVQISIDGGSGWNTLTSKTGTSSGFPSFLSTTVDLSSYAGNSVLLRFLYSTDSAVLYDGVYLDDIVVTAGSSTIFSDDGESGSSKWVFANGFELNPGAITYSHDYYFQWRNVGSDGGYDNALGDARWRYGPANTGLLAWYYNNKYTDNEILSYLDDGPSYGPKGKMLLFDAHPDPYRFSPYNPYSTPDTDWKNEVANHPARSHVRDATFSTLNSVDFNYGSPSVGYQGRAAVSTFSDSYGYYPGLEYTWFWSTKGWDYSAVVPATSKYSVKGSKDDSTLFSKETDSLYYRLYLNSSGSLMGYNYAPNTLNNLGGGTGNPSSSGVQFGWNARIVDQTTQSARLVIWNGAAASSPVVMDVSKTGVGTGTVASVGDSGINCGSVCSKEYASGSTVTLRATGGDKSGFNGWSGGGCSGTGDCSVTLSADTQVSAEFITCYSLSAVVSPSGAGQVNILTTPNCAGGKYLPGTSVQVAISVPEGYVFNGWTGASGTSDSATLVMSDDTTVTANLVKCYGLTTGVSPTGVSQVNVKTATNCSGSKYLPGTVVQMSAAVPKGYSFVNWQGGALGAASSGSVTMDGDKAITAVFEKTCYSLNITINPAKGGTVKFSPKPNCGNGNYRPKTSVKVTATAKKKYSFLKWTGSYKKYKSKSFTVKMTKNLSGGVTFKKQ